MMLRRFGYVLGGCGLAYLIVMLALGLCEPCCGVPW